MITRVTISNYKSLGENVVLELGRLTALVGPNSSGKSNVADALMFVADAVRLGLDTAIARRQGIGAIRRWEEGRPLDVSFKIDYSRAEDWCVYGFTIKSDNEGGYRVSGEILELGSSPPESHGWENSIYYTNTSFSSHPDKLLLPGAYYPKNEGEIFDGCLRELAIYSIFPDALRQPQVIGESHPMSVHGENWASVLRRSDREGWKNDVLAALSRLTGDIDDYRVNQIGPYLVTEFRHGSDGIEANADHRWSVAAQESDGTLRVAGILAALYQLPSPSLIGIEEPELSVHPGMLRLLYDLLDEASIRSQVLVTTHSPELLSRFRADDIRVVERRDSITSIGRLAEPQRKVVEDRLLTLGELMLSEPLEQAPATVGGA